MNAPTLQGQLDHSLRRVRQRAGAQLLLIAAAPIAGVLLAASRWGLASLIAAAVVAALLVGVLMNIRLRRYDRTWLARRLNAARADLDDSVELIWDTAAVSPLQALQRERVRARLGAGELPDLREPLPQKALVLSLISGFVLIALTALLAWWPVSLPRLRSAAVHDGTAAIQAHLEIKPPAYTGLHDSTEDALEARVPENSEVTWSLGFAGAPTAVALAFHDGSRLELSQRRGRWTGSKVISASTLYRIDANTGASDEGLYRIDAIPDRAPEIVVRLPDKTLSVLDAAQPQWELQFEARDDYGLGEAELSIALAQGSGEDIKVHQQSRVLKGEGSERERRYHDVLDLHELGFAQGDDLIVRLSVRDNRQPEPNVTRSASFILRWPAESSTESAGMEGLVRHTMPAYFASERQIIIDSEALIAQRGQLPAEEFGRSSDKIGVDQKLLRLRYGQFLGEESEGGGAEHHHEDPHAATEPAAHDADDHGAHQAAEPGEPAPGSDAAILHEFGHVHDIKEAATLLDDATRSLLRSALNQMWDAEGQLRSAQPEAALPFEHRALEAIKQVQQSTRIYLARVGQDLPTVDLTRRLTGERAGLADPPAPQAAATQPLTAPAAAWQALQQNQVPDVAALQGWIATHADQSGDSLTLLREAERLHRDPECADCRAALRAQLWPLLPAPGTALQPRPLADAQGASYLQALPPPQPVSGP